MASRTPLSPDVWIKQFKKETDLLKRSLSQTPDDAAEFGANYAKRIAPKLTTTLVQSISFTASGANNKRQATIFVRPMNNPLGGVTTKYGAIMHRTPKGTAAKIWHSGDPHFMFTTRKVVDKKFKTNVRYAVGRFVGKAPKTN